MKFNQWTLALASVGIISAGSIAQAEEQHSVMTALQSTTLSGYVDTSASWWAGSRGPASGGLPGRSFDGADKQDGFNLNVVKLSLEKPLGDENNWSAGYRADLLFGPDAMAYSTLLNGTGINANGDDFSIKQAYVALRAPVGNGLDIKMGVWDTIIGYEFFDSSSNPNYSRSYGFFLEPLHHTGLLASYKISDMFAISGGIANTQGLGSPINDKQAIESNKAYMGAITITLPEGAGAFQNSVIALGAIHGRNGMATVVPGVAALGVAQSINNYYVGATLNTPVEGLTFGLSWDYLQDAGAAIGGSSDAYATALYLSYGKDKWKANLRADYTQATDGTYYSNLLNNGVSDRNELGSITGTLDYSLWENVLTRLEARWDHALSGDKPFGTADENAVTVTANVVYKF
jgi:hypothetical protein